jgi:hypothetical protein
VLQGRVSGRWSTEATSSTPSSMSRGWRCLVAAEREDRPAKSKNSCSGSAASSTISRGWPRC